MKIYNTFNMIVIGIFYILFNIIDSLIHIIFYKIHNKNEEFYLMDRKIKKNSVKIYIFFMDIKDYFRHTLENGSKNSYIKFSDILRIKSKTNFN